MNKKLFLFVPLLLLSLSAFMLPIVVANAAPLNYLKAWGSYNDVGSNYQTKTMFQLGDKCSFFLTVCWTGTVAQNPQYTPALGTGVWCGQTGSITAYLKVTQIGLITLNDGKHALLVQGTARIICGQWAGIYSFVMPVYPSLQALEFALFHNALTYHDGAFGYLTCNEIIVLPPLT
jgi:hypothetical protein